MRLRDKRDENFRIATLRKVSRALKREVLIIKIKILLDSFKNNSLQYDLAHDELKSELIKLLGIQITKTEQAKATRFETHIATRHDKVVKFNLHCDDCGQKFSKIINECLCPKCEEK